MATVGLLVRDSNGVGSEACAFDFLRQPWYVPGIIASSPAPVVSQQGPPGSAPLTISAPVLVGSQVRITTSGGTVGATYLLWCQVTLTNGLQPVAACAIAEVVDRT
jgi:hypothetical protein